MSRLVPLFERVCRYGTVMILDGTGAADRDKGERPAHAASEGRGAVLSSAVSQDRIETSPSDARSIAAAKSSVGRTSPRRSLLTMERSRSIRVANSASLMPRSLR